MIKTCVDKIIPPELAAEVAVSANPENEPVVVPGTYLGNTSRDLRQSGVILTGKKFTNGSTLKVAFGAAPEIVIEKTKQRFRYAESLVNLKLEFVSDWSAANIRVGFVQGDGSWSYLGTDNLAIRAGERTMNLGWLAPDTKDAEYDRVVVHEVFHMFGMPHEHQHPQGGIPWDIPKVYEYYGGPPNHWSKEEIDHNVLRRYSETITQYTEFDRESIMAYPVSNSLTIGDWWIGWNTRPSARDIEFLAQQYPKPAEPKKPEPEIPAMSYYKLGKVAGSVDKKYRVTKEDPKTRTVRTLGVIGTEGAS